MKFLVPNYSCLQNPWLAGYRLQIPVLSVLNWICWTPPEQNSWVRHCLWSLFSIPLYGGDVFARSSLHCLSLVQLPYLFCMFPVSRCQALVLFAVCPLGVFVPSPFRDASFPFSLSLWTLALKTKWKYFYCPVLSPHRCQKENCFLEGS